jgi:xanthine/uracil/vitamin C permease (AzgA family)
MGLLANLPVGLAPGLGLNAYVRIAHVIHTTSSFAILTVNGSLPIPS